MIVRRWLLYVLLGMAVIACAIQLFAARAALARDTLKEGPSHEEASMFFLAATVLPAVLVVNGLLAVWSLAGRPVVGPGVLWGGTLPTVALAVMLSLLGVGGITNPNGIGWGAMGYILFPIWWAIGVVCGVALGGLVGLIFRLAWPPRQELSQAELPQP